MMFWSVLGVMSLAALAFLVWPLFRGEKRLSLLLAGVIVFAVGLSASFYHYLGNPDVPSGAGSMPDVNEMVASLEARLKKNPDDIDGWKMLGRSYETLQNFDKSIVAYETAIELEQAKNPQTLVALAVVLMGQSNGELSARSSSLFENALALDPNNPNALFYAGAAAANRGNTELAADRWDLLLGLDPPESIRNLLLAKVNEWRGVTATPAPVEALSEALSVSISVADEVANTVAADTTVFVIVRDPAQPSPPIAVVRRQLVEFPTQVVFSDRDAMIPGRPLSAFANIEIVARVSLSGEPAAQAGDWFGSIVVDRRDADTIELAIDQVVP